MQPTDRPSLRIYKWALKHIRISVWRCPETSWGSSLQQSLNSQPGWRKELVLTIGPCSGQIKVQIPKLWMKKYSTIELLIQFQAFFNFSCLNKEFGVVYLQRMELIRHSHLDIILDEVQGGNVTNDALFIYFFQICNA